MNAKYPLTIVLLILAVVFSSVPVWAQPKIHAVIVADTGDKSIGKSTAQDLGYMVLAFMSQVPESQFTFKTIEKQGVNSKNILAAVAALAPAANDTLVFYYSGHGAYDQQGHWLAMPDSSKLYRNTVLEAMKNKNARLVVLMTDSCNVFAGGETGRPKNLPSVMPPDQVTPLFDELFFRHKGVLNVNSSSEGEISLGPDEGGLFTLALAYPARANPRLTGALHTRENQRATWQTILNDANRGAKASYTALAPRGFVSEGKTYTTQTVRVWSWPQRVGN